MARTFFGPTHKMRETFLEESFLLQYHLKMPYGDIRQLPLPYRRWFIERLSKEFKKQIDAQKKAHDDSRNIQEIPMGEMYSQIGLDSDGPPGPPKGRTLKFGSE